jgi:hypothetical protein
MSALFKPVMVYICLGVAAFATEVDMAWMLLDLRPDTANSTMDSSDVAHRLTSPGKASASHSARVFLIEAAFSELGSMEKRERISGRLDEEKGTVSATCRGRSREPAVARIKWSVIVDPGWRLFSKKNIEPSLSTLAAGTTALHVKRVHILERGKKQVPKSTNLLEIVQRFAVWICGGTGTALINFMIYILSANRDSSLFFLIIPLLTYHFIIQRN